MKTKILLTISNVFSKDGEKMRLKVARCSEPSIDRLNLIDWQGALSLVEPKTTYDWPGPRGRGGNRGGRGRSKKGGKLMLRIGKKH